MAARYLAAVLVPIATAAVMPVQPAILGPFFLWIALAARFLGFGSAVACSAASAASLWWIVFPRDQEPPTIHLAQIAFFLVAAGVIAALRRQRSKAALDAEQRYRSLVDLSPDGIVILDDVGTFLFANEASAHMYGFDHPSGLIGRNLDEFVHPDDREVARVALERYGTGQPTGWQVSRIIKADGSVAVLEGAGVPMRRHGRYFVQAFIRYVTPAIETAPDAILLYDTTGRCLYANAVAVAFFGHSRDRLTDRTQLDELHTALGRGSRSGEASVVTADGARRHVTISAGPYLLPQLRALLLRDITRETEAERVIHELPGRLLQAQDEERRRIGSQLHDTTAQDLVAIRLNLARVAGSPGAAGLDLMLRDAIDESLSLGDKAITEIRTLSYLLHPPMIVESGLPAALRWYAKGFEKRSGINVDLQTADDLQLAGEIGQALFRIIQEALTNIQRHSGSAVALIRIVRDNGTVHLTVRDEGHGMPAQLRNDPNALYASGVGIAGIRERVRDLGGHMEIDSTDHGTTLLVTLPRVHVGSARTSRPIGEPRLD
jgi:PAS domain S-box-containing protein